MNFILEQWDAIDLFCKLAAKQGTVTIKELQNEFAIESCLRKYLNRDFAESVSKKIIDHYNDRLLSKKIKKGNSTLEKKSDRKQISDEQIERTPNWSRLMNDIASAIRNGEPVILSNEQLMACLYYIDDKKLQPTDRQQLFPFTPNTKRQRLHNTKWCLYFMDDHHDSNIEKHEESQILSRATLILKPFGKAEIIRGIEDKEKIKIVRDYEGYYDLYDNNYLLVRTKIKGYDRDLRIVFYIGSLESMKLSLGIASNILHDEFFAHKVLIQPFDDAVKNYDIPDFFNVLEKSSTVPKYVWDYFDNLSNNIIVLPTGITNFPQLNTYLTGIKG